MFLDLEAVRAHNKPYRVIIVGSGPAGMSMALEFERQGVACLLVEAGGEQYPDADGLDPYHGEVTGRPYPLQPSRLRFLGGTSGHWGGWVRPQDPWDFEAASDSDVPGWPISHAEAYSRLGRASALLEVDGDDYESEAVLAELAPHAIDLVASPDFRRSVFRFSPPTRFGTRYRAALDTARHVDCLLRTSLVRVERDANGRSRLHFVNGSGEKLSLQAEAHVLALGGIENARFLLWSRETGYDGLGGDGDWTGRCFADHIGLTTGVVLARSRLDYDRRQTAGGSLMARIAPSAARVRGGEINHMFSLTPTRTEQVLESDYGSNRVVFGSRAERFAHYVLIGVAEQRPLRSSRVRLSSERDNLDVPRIELQWDIDDRDFRDLLASTDRLGRWLAANGLGRLRRTGAVPERAAAVSVGMHHMGTTRMAADATRGVVDTNCKVFGTTDMYVAGSSVFSRFGYVNPTLTIVSLALRLSDHLVEALGKSP